MSYITSEVQTIFDLVAISRSIPPLSSGSAGSRSCAELPKERVHRACTHTKNTHGDHGRRLDFLG